MESRDKTARFVDAVLKFSASSATLGAAIVLPNIMIGLEKPMNRLFDNLDKREREREARRIIYSMKARGYLVGEYEHGLKITEKGRKRLKKLAIDELAIEQPEKWDKKWRLVIYDIPEANKEGRWALSAKLRQIGFFQLQRSVWIHPLPCKEIIEKITSEYEIEQFVSYLECISLDNEAILIKRFHKHLPNVKF